ncbi:TIGR02594 family protein [[Pseudomonas] carboxydohydrogena]|uniref:TIGR02594 family protein n=2 Tax=Afipia carboxydohydrogena TaxID=290 RepID=A0ABY8BQF6_AFICR|nr:TIGR02594 family protein [[Pseudomonas] carboxydohydrogena]WEF52224.1 TIGR02594 family protein [[Pseudomonas] carboxydohydrogena]
MCTVAVAVAVAAITNPAEARPRHHGRHHVSQHHAHKHHAHRHHVRHSARWGAFRAQAQQFGETNASMDTSGGFGGGFGGSNVVAEARSFIGKGNPTGRSRLWCARFMNMVLQKTGHKGTGSDMASSFARYGQRVSGPQIGAIAVMSRGRRGGHVGVVSGIDAKGNPIIISGNHGHRVAEATYSRGRIYAYVMPSS